MGPQLLNHSLIYEGLVNENEVQIPQLRQPGGTSVD
jgi:hypothetical protein